MKDIKYFIIVQNGPLSPHPTPQNDPLSPHPPPHFVWDNFSRIMHVSCNMHVRDIGT